MWASNLLDVEVPRGRKCARIVNVDGAELRVEPAEAAAERLLVGLIGDHLVDVANCYLGFQTARPEGVGPLA